MAEKLYGVVINNTTYEFGNENSPSVIDCSSEADLSTADDNGNVLIEFKDGHVKTQKFDSRYTQANEGTTDSGELAIADQGRNIVLRLKDGHIETQKFNSRLVGLNNYWSEKSIWWCGTSIPAGSDATLGSEETVAGMYPKQVGINLNATVFNEAVGGSMCRANVRTGDYNGVNPSNLTSCLSRTKAEVEDLITNYDTYKLLSGNTSWPASLSTSDINRLRSSSFEDKLLPYLVGEVTAKNPNGLIPDLFVIDHGHNDFKYKLANNTTDIELEPTVENITNNRYRRLDRTYQLSVFKRIG